MRFRGAVTLLLLAVLAASAPDRAAATPRCGALTAVRHAPGCARAVSACKKRDGARSCTWFVRAGAAAPGRGTRRAPFASLATVRAAAHRRDRIVVLPGTAPLDDGLRLRAGQTLVGRGTPAPALTNTGTNLDGDAVRLAPDATVRHIAVLGATRGGIYGRNTPGVRVLDVDVSGHNTSCAQGFLIPPFAVPTLVTGVGIPIPTGLQNGWAGIQLDASSGRGTITVKRSRVHDSECGDGIDVRLSGDARRRVVIGGNTVTNLREGSLLQSVLAIGLQTDGTSRMNALVDRNTQGGLGNDEDLGAGPSGADSEGVFVNPVGHSRLRATVSRNMYTHVAGRGGFSANGLEFVSMGDGASGHLVVRDSELSGPPGDVIEQLALGTNGHLSLELDNVTARDSTGFSGSGYGNTVVIPGNNGDCVIGASGGSGNTVDLTVTHSRLTGCANNGLTFGSSVANGSGPTSALNLSVSDSVITGNRGHNLRIGNVSGLGTLRAKIERNDLSDARGAGSELADVSFEDLGSTNDAIIDMGGGPLGSTGGNCITGGPFAVNLMRYSATARSNWWGDPAGPALGRVTPVGGTLDAGAPLASDPC